MPRIAPADAAAALSRPQPVVEGDLAWGCAYTQVWDGTIFQVLRRRIDEETGQPALQYDDDGVAWAAFDTDDAATGEAAHAYQAEHPYPDETFRAAADDEDPAEDERVEAAERAEGLEPRG